MDDPITSAASVPDEGRSVIEVRVHGIGDHAEWSSLGRPDVLWGDDGDGISLVAPPKSPAHRVELFNWSRVTRRVLRALWYLAFPYTLMNMAYQMTPAGRGWRHRTAHKVLVHLASIGLTLLTTIWVLSAAERMPLLFNRFEIYGVDALRASFWVLGAAPLIAVILVRALRSEGPEHRRYAALHAGLVLVVAAAIDLLQPAQWILSLDSLFIAHASYGPDGEGLRQIGEYFASNPSPLDHLRVEQFPYLDPVGLLTYVCLAVVLGIAATLLLLGSGRDTGPMAGAAAAVTLGTLLSLLTLTAVFRSLPQLLAPLLRWAGLGPAATSVDALPRTRITAQYGPSTADHALPLVALVLLLLFALSILAFSRFRMRFATHPASHALRTRLFRIKATASDQEHLESTRQERLRWSHNFITERLPTALTLALVVFLFGSELLLYVLIRYLMDRVDRDEDKWFMDLSGYQQEPASPMTIGDRAVAWGVALAVAVGFWVLSRGASGALKGVLGSIGDVAGFWPISVNPYGGRHYRQKVSLALDEVLADRGPANVVLVGHSQGSVLAAWYASGRQRPPHDEREKLCGLVTCGSPLASLYARFFPTTFTSGFFEDVRDGTEGWCNYWRQTDPIATALGTPAVDTELDDPEVAGQPARGHSDYWIDGIQAADIQTTIHNAERERAAASARAHVDEAGLDPAADQRQGS